MKREVGEELYSHVRLECSCMSFDHNMRISVDNEDGHIYIDVPLNQYRKWYERIWLGIKYIFGITPRFGHYDTVALKHEDFSKIRALLDKSEKIAKDSTDEAGM